MLLKGPTLLASNGSIAAVLLVQVVSAFRPADGIKHPTCLPYPGIDQYPDRAYGAM